MAFPYLYNNRPRKVRLGVYHLPQVMYIKVSATRLAPVLRLLWLLLMACGGFIMSHCSCWSRL